MSTELTSSTRLYDDGPMTVKVGHSYVECVQYFRDVQNQALEVAAEKLVEEGVFPRSPRFVRSLKHRPKPDPEPDLLAACGNVMARLLRVEIAPSAIELSGAITDLDLAIAKAKASP